MNYGCAHRKCSGWKYRRDADGSGRGDSWPSRRVAAGELYRSLADRRREDELLKKLAEEASEVIMACKDNDHDHIRYEAGDLIYHLLVTLERYGITLDELAGELNARRH